jgi:hypothetical protein
MPSSGCKPSSDKAAQQADGSLAKAIQEIKLDSAKQVDEFLNVSRAGINVETYRCDRLKMDGDKGVVHLMMKKTPPSP